MAYRQMDRLNKEESNNIIKEYISNKNPFILCRMDLTTIRWIDWYIRGGICDKMHSENTSIESKTLEQIWIEHGFDKFALHFFLQSYIKSLKSADLQVHWDKFLPLEQANIFDNYSKGSIKIDSESLCPYLHTDFWTQALKGKKVLIIHMFEETIKEQYKKRALIWKDEKLPEFELITYKPIWTGSGNSAFVENFTKMYNEISKIDFDITIICNAFYGIPLLRLIKENLNKSAIYMGGELQILFGIKGARWDGQEQVNKFYNEHWIYPIDEKPEDWNIPLTDHGCYW